MNVPSLIVLAVVVLLAAAAVWRIVRKGGGCECGSAACQQGCAHCAQAKKHRS